MSNGKKVKDHSTRTNKKSEKQSAKTLTIAKRKLQAQADLTEQPLPVTPKCKQRKTDNSVQKVILKTNSNQKSDVNNNATVFNTKETQAVVMKNRIPLGSKSGSKVSSQKDLPQQRFLADDIVVDVTTNENEEELDYFDDLDEGSDKFSNDGGLSSGASSPRSTVIEAEKEADSVELQLDKSDPQILKLLEQMLEEKIASGEIKQVTEPGKHGANDNAVNGPLRRRAIPISPAIKITIRYDNLCTGPCWNHKCGKL